MLTRQRAAARRGSYTDVAISHLTREGLWEGTATISGQQVIRDATRSSWLADGFLEGQWVEICRGATCVRAKVAIIRGDNATKDEKLELRAVDNLAGAGRQRAGARGRGSRPSPHFGTNDWFKQQTIVLTRRRQLLGAARPARA